MMDAVRFFGRQVRRCIAIVVVAWAHRLIPAGDTRTVSAAARLVGAIYNAAVADARERGSAVRSLEDFDR